MNYGFRRRPERSPWPVVAAFALIGLLVVGCSSQLTSPSPSPPTSSGKPVVINRAENTPHHSDESKMVERVLPSLVNVRVTDLRADPFGGSETVKAEGSGAIISRDGYILTNNHVVDGAVSVKVLFNDGRDAADGSVVGTDPDRDLAVVKVDEINLTPVTIGHSGDLKLGDRVTALGFPLGLGGPTVTQGIVSGLNRSVQVGGGEQGTENLVGLLQTDAAINPGNSGGPLVDADGNLIGINTAAAQAGSAENIGFAISIDEALPVARELISTPPSHRAWLGVQMGSVDSATQASELGLPLDTRGAVIAGVVPDGPAAQAGLRAGEVVTEINGSPVTSAEDVTRILRGIAPGDHLEISVVGPNGERTVNVTADRRPPNL
jgi:S1-C subfamily serine protease